MIPVPPNSSLNGAVRVWLSAGRTDMRRGMNGLALQVQEALGRDPFAGDLYVFRGQHYWFWRMRAGGDLVKVLWHAKARNARLPQAGLGLSLYAKRLERGRFIWPSASGEAVAISAAQLAYMLDGIDWRHPLHTVRPQRAG